MAETVPAGDTLGHLSAFFSGLCFRLWWILEWPTCKSVRCGPYRSPNWKSGWLIAGFSVVPSLPHVQVRQDSGPWGLSNIQFRYNKWSQKTQLVPCNLLFVIYIYRHCCVPMFCSWGFIFRSIWVQILEFLYHKREYWHTDSRRPPLPNATSADLFDYALCPLTVFLCTFFLFTDYI